MGKDLPKPDDRINPLTPPDESTRAAKIAREALQSESLGRPAGDRKTLSTGADSVKVAARDPGDGTPPKVPADAPKAPTELPKASADSPKGPADATKDPTDKGLGAPAPKATDSSAPNPAKPANAEADRPVFFDPARGWYTKDGSNKIVPFNQGGKPVYDQAKHEWVKPLEAAPPPGVPIAPVREQVRPNDLTARPPVEAYRPPAQNKVIEINSKAEFDRLVLNAKGPVLVDFSMTGCGPCIGLAPKIDALAREFSGRASVYKVMDADWAQGQFANSYPTTRIFDRGQMSQPIMGNVDSSVLRNSLNSQLRRHQSEQQPLVAPLAPQRLDQSFNPTPDARTDRTQVPPDRLNKRPLEPFAISGFHSEAERERFERWAHKKGFSAEAIQKAETMNEQEWNCFNSMNQYRASIHKRPLQFSPRVKLMSDQQASYQASVEQMTHDSPGLAAGGLPPQVQRMQRIGLGRFTQGWTHEGENAAFVPPNANTQGLPEGKFVTNQWLGSPGHLKPIQDDLLTIGAVSQQRSARTGNKYWTFNGSTGEGEKI